MRKVSVVAVIGLMAAGCGGGGASTTNTTPNSVMKTITVCSGLTDKCVKSKLPANGGQYRLAPRSTRTLTPTSGCHVVDVSDYQGQNLNWSHLARYVCGGIAKAGESTCTSCGGKSFRHNWTSMRQAHLWHSAYWFERPGNCTAQGRIFVRQLNSVGYKTDKLAGNPVLDEEVSGANQLSCIAKVIWNEFHRKVVQYTSPGTNPGGSHSRAIGLWQAEYGPTLHPVWKPVVAWQCTDGIYGCKTYVPGLGYSDVSKDLGITKEHAASTKPTGPVCFGKHWQHTKHCLAVRAEALHIGYNAKQQKKFLSVSLANLKKFEHQLNRYKRLVAKARTNSKKERAKLAVLVCHLETLLKKNGLHISNPHHKGPNCHK